MHKPILLFILIPFFTIAIFGQEKYEKEYRIHKHIVPVQAQKFIEALQFTKKIKWYREEGINNTYSIEAKTKHKSKKYSVEFDSSGVIEDIEIEIGWKEISIKTRNNITQYLNDHFEKHKIHKLQIQYTGSQDSLLKAVLNKDSRQDHDVAIHYEIVLRIKKGKKHQKLEILFDEGGKMIRKSKILLLNTDILEY